MEALGPKIRRQRRRLGFRLDELAEKTTISKPYSLATDEPWPPRKGLHVHGPARLPVRFETRDPAS